MADYHLSGKEMDRLLIIQQISNGSLTQDEAAECLGLSSRQVRRLLRRVQAEGPGGIKAKHLGGNRAFKAGFRQRVIEAVSAKYPDFGPTFASEKLREVENLAINKETLRQWMMSVGLWKGRARKRARIHQCRERRPRFGELVQIDGSHHDWFEGRAAKCCLLVFIDDATGKVLGLHFDKSENTLGYMVLVKQHLLTYGRPVAYYSDKHSIFKQSREHCVDRQINDTQLHRALRALGIELICAHSSQAKGRVERVNQTLQDRLIKELRLRQLSTIESANAYMPEFIAAFNQRFSIPPTHPEDAHRPLYQDAVGLKRILSVHTQRKLSKNLEFSLEGITHQILTQTTGYRLRHKTITICEHTDGQKEVLCDGTSLEYQLLSKARGVREADAKGVNIVLDQLLYEAHENREAAPDVKMKPMDMWTSPTDQPTPYGTCGQAMDNASALPTA
jgi:transposase